jgi:CheY-like chemotaxis protein
MICTETYLRRVNGEWVSTPSEPDLLYPLLPARSDSERWKNSVLWVDKDHARHTLLRQDFEAFGVTFIRANSVNKALDRLSSNRFAAIISDVNHPCRPRAGYTLLNTLRNRGDRTPFFFMRSKEIGMSVRLMNITHKDLRRTGEIIPHGHACSKCPR